MNPTATCPTCKGPAWQLFMSIACDKCQPPKMAQKVGILGDLSYLMGATTKAFPIGQQVSPVNGGVSRMSLILPQWQHIRSGWHMGVYLALGYSNGDKTKINGRSNVTFSNDPNGYGNFDKKISGFSVRLTTNGGIGIEWEVNGITGSELLTHPDDVSAFNQCETWIKNSGRPGADPFNWFWIFSS